jgi:hypothetical protein
MRLLKEIGMELAAMFAGDLRLAACVLALVAGTAVLANLARLGSLAAGAVLLLGCLAILLESVHRAAVEARSGR